MRFSDIPCFVFSVPRFHDTFNPFGDLMRESGSPNNYPICSAFIQESIVSLIAIFCLPSTHLKGRKVPPSVAVSQISLSFINTSF